MESSMSKHERTELISGDQTGEESSWTLYFEDFFKASSSLVVSDGDYNPSSISDAASQVSNQQVSNHYNKFNIKKTRNKEIPFATHHDLEDTASSPSRTTYNIFSMMNPLENSRRHGGVIVGDDDTTNERGDIPEKNNRDGLSVDLEKKGLCLFPLSMLTNFLP